LFQTVFLILTFAPLFVFPIAQSIGRSTLVIFIFTPFHSFKFRLPRFSGQTFALNLLCLSIFNVFSSIRVSSLAAFKARTLCTFITILTIFFALFFENLVYFCLTLLFPFTSPDFINQISLLLVNCSLLSSYLVVRQMITSEFYICLLNRTSDAFSLCFIIIYFTLIKDRPSPPFQSLSDFNFNLFERVRGCLLARP
jgi:hypothetical protein